MNCFAFVFPLLFVALASSARAGEDRELIIVAGQSNAVGFDAYASELPAEAADKSVMFWWRCGDPPPDDHDSTSGRKWTYLQPQPQGTPEPKDPALNGEKPTYQKRQYGNFKKQEGGFGPEIGMARALRAHGDKSLAIVKAAFSGTAMRTDWNPSDEGDGGACYRALVSETRAAIAAAKGQDTTLRLRALVWVQGESDANAQDAPNYEQNLRRLIEAFRKDTNQPDLTILVGVNTHFGNDKNVFMPKIVEAQKAVASKDAHCVYVDTEGAETLLPSQTHFTAKGTLEVGRRFAEALRRAERAH